MRWREVTRLVRSTVNHAIIVTSEYTTPAGRIVAVVGLNKSANSQHSGFGVYTPDGSLWRRLTGGFVTEERARSWTERNIRA